jgi:hypothetical protein
MFSFPLNQINLINMSQKFTKALLSRVAGGMLVSPRLSFIRLWAMKPSVVSGL